MFEIRAKLNYPKTFFTPLNRTHNFITMGWIGEQIDSVKSMQFRQLFTQAISLGMIVTSALIIWKGLMCITGSESPVVVVLSGSMEPGFKRGDILFLHMSKEPIRAGEIVVFNVDYGNLLFHNL
ncbi:putative signal peptidase I [Helianthus annuus]|nr:putative signal peptidase I [Helianthus annuus]